MQAGGTTQFWRRAGLGPLSLAGAILLFSGCGKKSPAGDGATTPAPAEFVKPDVAPGTPQYQPRLAPRFQAGQPFGYRANATLLTAMRMTVRRPADGGGPAPAAESVANEHQESVNVVLEGEGLARGVYANGELREAVFLVRRCEVARGGGKTEVIAPPGAVLGVRKLDGGQVIFTINGEPMSQVATNYAGLVVQVGDKKSTLDDLLGPPVPVPVGTSWPVKPRALLQSGFAQTYAGANQATGGLRLEAVETDVAGREVATVTGGFSLAGVKAPFPEEVESVPSVVSFQLRSRGPVAGGPGQHEADLKTLIRHLGKTGSLAMGVSESRMELNVAVDQHAVYTFDPALPVPPALAAAPSMPDKPPPPPAADPAARQTRVVKPPPLPSAPKAAVAGESTGLADAIPAGKKESALAPPSAGWPSATQVVPASRAPAAPVAASSPAVPPPVTSPAPAFYPTPPPPARPAFPGAQPVAPTARPAGEQ